MAQWPDRGEVPWDDKLKAYIDDNAAPPPPDDTGWLDINSYLRAGPNGAIATLGTQAHVSGSLKVRRVGNTVTVWAKALISSDTAWYIRIPSGFKPVEDEYLHVTMRDRVNVYTMANYPWSNLNDGYWFHHGGWGPWSVPALAGYLKQSWETAEAWPSLPLPVIP